MDNAVIHAAPAASATSALCDDSRVLSEEPYMALASDIILQAVKDYIDILRSLWEKGLTLEKKRKLIIDKAELEDFFYSDWYELLTDLNPDKLLSGCRRKALEQEKESIREKNIEKMKQMKKMKKMKKIKRMKGAAGAKGAEGADGAKEESSCSGGTPERPVKEH